MKTFTEPSFEFDKITDRTGTNSLKWDVKPGELPLWVADMDFQTAPCIRRAIEKTAAHGIFGYSIVTDEWYKSYIDWWKKRHDFQIQKDWLIFCNGVVPAVSSLVRKLTTPAEKVLIQTPTYNIFFNSILNNGRVPVESELGFDSEKNQYFMDFDRLEKDLSDPQVSLMILCNPQNPTGNIWTKEDLSKIGSLCKKYGVTVISDEIHCDISEPGTSYVPFASASEICRDISVSCIAPSKCFGIPGINTAAVVVPEEHLRHKVWRSLNTDEVAEPNSFAIDATIAAFTQGEPWLDSLNEYLFENRKFAEKFLSDFSPDFTVIKGKATYLLWVKVNGDGDDFARQLREKTGLFINGGSEYGKSGQQFVRINLACPRSVLKEALNRFVSYSSSKAPV